MLPEVTAFILTVLAALVIVGTLVLILGFVFTMPFAVRNARERHEEIEAATRMHQPLPHI
ncbi:MAG: hypothetical protein U1E29_01440 [Coriobacteriia bacterium]|nr:hypothetical protein [Coriobacteriia bacterium]